MENNNLSNIILGLGFSLLICAFIYKDKSFLNTFFIVISIGLHKRNETKITL